MRTRTCGLALLSMAVAMAIPLKAGAIPTLIGDSVNGSLNAGGFPAFSGSATIADPGIEFQGITRFLGGVSYQVDFTANTLTVGFIESDGTFQLDQFNTPFAFTSVNFSESAHIVGLTLLSNTFGGDPIFGSFTADSITVTLPNGFHLDPHQQKFATFGIEVPEPATMLLLAGGLAALGFGRRRPA